MCTQGGSKYKLCNFDQCSICFNKSLASSPLARIWDYSKNENIIPRQLGKQSNKKFWFKCDKCYHPFDLIVYNATNSRYTVDDICPFCRGIRLCGKYECSMCFSRSFASSPFAKYWHSDNDVIPINVHLYCHKKYKFNCDCGHIIMKDPGHITSGHWCPYCTSQSLCDNMSCVFCYEKSFASHPRAKYWNMQLNSIHPRFVFKSHGSAVWFNCDCGHTFSKRPSDIVREDSWCSYCGRKKLCDKPECIMCYNFSFASHPRVRFWHPVKNGDLSPRYVYKYTNVICWFICENGHEFNSIIHRISSGGWCSLCIYKTQEMIFQWLKDNKYNVSREMAFDWCTWINVLRFDFYLPDYKLLIELDGKQHFEQVLNWIDPETNQERDVHKMKCALDNGLSMIRIDHAKVYRKTEWQDELLKNIKIYDKPQIVYLGDSYDNHKNKLDEVINNMNKININ